MKIETQTVAILSMEELEAVIKLIGVTSQNFRTEHGLTTEQSKLLVHIHSEGDKDARQDT